MAGGIGSDKIYVPSNLETLDQEIFRDIFYDLIQFDHDKPDLNDPPPMELMQMFLNPTAIKMYFAWFLSQDLNIELSNYREVYEPSIPRVLKDFKLVQNFISATTSTPIKEKGTHPLTRKEYKQAAKFLENNPQIQSAFHVFDAGMIGYLTTLRRFLVSQTILETERTKDNSSEETSSLYQKFKNTLEALEGGALSFGIIQELMPLAVHSMAKSKETPLPRSAQQGLREGITSRSAFDSIILIEDGPFKITCPFKKIIGHIYNSSFIVDQKGTVKTTETIEPAGLLVAITKRLEGLSNNPTLEPKSI